MHLSLPAVAGIVLTGFIIFAVISTWSTGRRDGDA